MSEEAFWTEPDEFQKHVDEKEAEQNDFQHHMGLYICIQYHLCSYVYSIHNQ